MKYDASMSGLGGRGASRHDEIVAMERGDAERQARLDEDTATGRELQRDQEDEGPAERAAATLTASDLIPETRFTMGLIGDVAAVLDAHGYHQTPDPLQVGQFIGVLVSLTRAYEGLPEHLTEGGQD